MGEEGEEAEGERAATPPKRISERVSDGGAFSSFRRRKKLAEGAKVLCA